MAQLDALFHPKSVAVVGVPKGMKTGRLFLMALLDQGYPGHIYPVNPQAKEIDGLKAYPSVASIPEFDPDLAQTFCKAGVPFFETAERAMQTYARVRRYQLWRQKRNSLS
jgi:acyl-CoA synthetase (NDP forming)